MPGLIAKRPIKFDDANHPSKRVSSAMIDLKFDEEEEK